MHAKKKKQRNTERLKLPNGCECTAPYISPANWESSKASVKDPWYLRFTFYDPVRRPGGKQINWEGMNTKMTLTERQADARELLDNVIAMLKDGYNPEAKKLIRPAETADVGAQAIDPGEVITANTPLIRSLEWAGSRATWGHETRRDVRGYMTIITPSIRALRYDTLPIHAVTIQHVENVLAMTYKTKAKHDPKQGKDVPITWSNYRKNKAKAYLSAHFGIMKKKKVIKENPCSGIEELPWQKKQEDAYTVTELRDMSKRLHASDPDYAVFMMLFYDSGARETEFMKLRKADVDLRRQTFRREILKGAHMRGRNAESPEGTISDAALPYWEKLVAKAKDGEYLFSRGFRPGPKQIRTEIINKRWQRIIKPHYPNSRPYLMKHTNLTDIADQFGGSIAAAAAGHTSTEMLDKVYDKRKDQRNHEALRKKTNLLYLAQPADAERHGCAALPCTFIPVNVKNIGA